jgi:acetyltransferase
MAIHPYPSHWIRQYQLADGTNIVIRPIRPEDAEIEKRFVKRLSPEAKFFRFMNSLQELSQDMLIRLTQLDYDRELALVAITDSETEETELGVARYFTNPDGETAEFALVVADEWQHRGLGTRLMSCLIDAARERGLKSIQGEVLANNVKMLGLMKKLAFACRTNADDPTIIVAEKPL